MDASSAIIPQVQVEFFEALNQSTLPEADHNKLMAEVYQNAQKYINEETDASQLYNFKEKIQSELGTLLSREKSPKEVSITQSLAATIIQVHKKNCNQLLKIFDQNINLVATRALDTIKSIPSTAITSQTPLSLSPTTMDAAALSRLKQNREKTEKIKEQIIRDIIDPDFQVNDILNFVEKAYKSSPFTKEFALAKELIARKQVDTITIPADMHQKVFPILLATLTRIEVLREEVKKYDDPTKYKMNPVNMALIAQMANVLISFEMLEGKELGTKDSFGFHITAKKLVNTLEGIGNNILKEINSKSPLESIKAVGINKSFHMYEHMYPIILCGNLGLYTFEAGVFAFANKVALLGMIRSDRGIHGGLYQEPLVIFTHDIYHHIDIIPKNSSVLAARFLHFSQSLYNVIKEKIPENEQEFFFWGAHILLHETVRSDYSGDNQVNNNPVLSEIFGMCWVKALNQFFFEINLKSELEPWETKHRELQDKLLYTPGGVKIDTLNSIHKLELYRTNPSQKIENMVTAGTPEAFPYDVIESMINLNYDPEKKRAMENKVLPGLANFSANLKTTLQQKHKFSDKMDKTSNEYKNYLKDLNSQLYAYKTQNYNPIEAYKAFRECMYEFKNRVMPFLQEIDKANGPIVDANYKNVWEQGKEI